MRWILAAVIAASTTWSFESDEPGREPAGFTFAVSRRGMPGRWVVQQDGAGRVLAQLDADKTGSRFAMAVAKDASFRDVGLSVRAKPVAGTVDQAAGLVWRWQDADNYYLARANAL